MCFSIASSGSLIDFVKLFFVYENSIYKACLSEIKRKRNRKGGSQAGYGAPRRNSLRF